MLSDWLFWRLYWCSEEHTWCVRAVAAKSRQSKSSEFIFDNLCTYELVLTWILDLLNTTSEVDRRLVVLIIRLSCLRLPVLTGGNGGHVVHHWLQRIQSHRVSMRHCLILLHSAYCRETSFDLVSTLLSNWILILRGAVLGGRMQCLNFIEMVQVAIFVIQNMLSVRVPVHSVVVDSVLKGTSETFACLLGWGLFDPGGRVFISAASSCVLPQAKSLRYCIWAMYCVLIASNLQDLFRKSQLLYLTGVRVRWIDDVCQRMDLYIWVQIKLIARAGLLHLLIHVADGLGHATRRAIFALYLWRCQFVLVFALKLLLLLIVGVFHDQ